MAQRPRRRVKAKPWISNPRLYDNPRSQEQEDERLTRIHRLIDVEAEKARIEKGDRYEAYGRMIGIIIHWIVVKPMQLAWAIIIELWHMVAFVFKHINEIMLLVVTIYFLGGIAVVAFLIMGVR